MEKNPISCLQEYMLAKRKITPMYEVVKAISGTHLNTFHVKVTCGEYSADGIGSSKKEARTNAALKMMSLLNINSKSLSSSPLTRYMPSTSEQSVNDESFVNKVPKSSINFIGKLQEFAINRGSLPEYVDKAVIGPPHNPVFTIVCKYQGLEEEAKANNKKEAKSLAAKKMFERVSSEMKIIIQPREIESYLQTVSTGMETLKIYKDNKTAMERSTERALKNFPQLSKTPVTTTSTQENRNFNEYHMFLRTSFPYRERQLVVDKLEDTLNSCKSCSSLGDQNSNPMKMLKVALDTIKINIKEVPHGMKSNTNICILQLDTNPIISEIGYGKTKKHAEIYAIFSMVQTLIIMLS